MNKEGKPEPDHAYESFIHKTHEDALSADILESPSAYATLVMSEAQIALSEGIQSPEEKTALLAKLDAVFEATKDPMAQELKLDIEKLYPDAEK